VRNLVEEKETRIQEGLKMMGLSNVVFWLSWAITYALMMLISSAILTAILSGGLFNVLSPALVFFICFFFSLSTISLAIVRVINSSFNLRSVSDDLLRYVVFLSFFGLSLSPHSSLRPKLLVFCRSSCCSSCSFRSLRYISIKPLLSIHLAFMPHELTADL
jgi:hypothetical protein